MSNIQIYKKPELAVLSDEKKIVAYNDVERLTIAKKITESLLNTIGVGNNSNEDHHIELIKFISEEKYFTPGEIKKAFDLVLRGHLKIDLFQQINCLIYGKVMNLYRQHKLEKLKVYNQKERERKYIAEMENHKNEYSERNAALRLFKEFKEENRIIGVVEHIYPYLFKQKVLPDHTKDFRTEMMKRATAVALLEAEVNTSGTAQDILQAINKVKIGDDSQRINRVVKRLIIDLAFRRLIEKNVELETLI